MSSKISGIIASSVNKPQPLVTKVIDLLNSGSTVPFISRYRKEATGSMDEVVIGEIKLQYEKLLELEKRKETILKSIEEQGKLNDELNDKISNTYVLNELEDLYLPYKPKRKTKASQARDKGLEPLARIIMAQHDDDVLYKAERFVNDEVESPSEALQGARYIVAEWISEKPTVRNIIRQVFDRSVVISSKCIKGKEEDADKYKDYFEFSQKLKSCPSHRILAMLRGEKEGLLRVSLSADSEELNYRLERYLIKSNKESSKQVELALKDSVKRLLLPSIESEYIKLAKQSADKDAIEVFAKNVKQLLLSPPLGQKRILAIDPGFRTGCKVVCLSEQGELLHNENIYPNAPQNDVKQAAKKISSMLDAYNISVIAIGNGTASRETEAFIRKLKYDKDVQVFIVSEDGASIYSASSVAREEFPQYDVTVRGAVSIGRRLMDPLAELVKIDPKSVGVGQYQHDVDQTDLKRSLDLVVESCVNSVGVNINTASWHLLSYISGLGPQLAKNIVDYRNENGAFTSRKDLQRVPRLGSKAFEQSAGFLRIAKAKNALDNSAVHPESYGIVNEIAKDCNCDVSTLIGNKEILSKVDASKYVSDTVGLPTIKDILLELDKPGRDPRKAIKVFEFEKGLRNINDIYVGMELPGIVTNLTNFGAFVDVGIKENGLVHISQITDRFISDPSQELNLHQHVKVKVLEVDTARKRIQLSMKL